jgi:hypothetical protein
LRVTRRELLKSEIDAVKRTTIAQLLAEEETKLAMLIDPPEENEANFRWPIPASASAARQWSSLFPP